jgi:hypothetical protein
MQSGTSGQRLHNVRLYFKTKYGGIDYGSELLMKNEKRNLSGNSWGKKAA